MGCQKEQDAQLESARSNNNDDNGEISLQKKRAKNFEINQQFILVCHEAGMGPGNADIVCSEMNLPLAVGFWLPGTIWYWYRTRFACVSIKF